jgi:hypothetical protein
MSAVKTAHGYSRSRIYRCYQGMKQRCTNPESPKYALYGGRGIAACPEWNDFGPFLQWSLANGYADHLTLDRKNGNDNYSPDNCRWATSTQQANNRRDNRSCEAFGEWKTVGDWSRDPRCMVSWRVLGLRVGRGWNPELAMTAPLLPHGRRQYLVGAEIRS